MNLEKGYRNHVDNASIWEVLEQNRNNTHNARKPCRGTESSQRSHAGNDGRGWWEVRVGGEQNQRTSVQGALPKLGTG